MGTLADLKARIALELNRTDLTDFIADQIARSVDRYANRRFWFNESTGTTTTTANQETATAPSGLRVIDKLFITVSGVKYELEARSLATIQDWLGSTTTTGRPTDYAFSGSTLTFYPEPDAVYTITAVGIFDLATLDQDSDETAWTDEAEDLIAYDVIERVARVRVRNLTLANEAKAQRDNALGMLRAETARRLSTGVKAGF